MLCIQCGGRLEGNLTICPYCNTRQDVDLSQIHVRPIASGENLPCPACDAVLESVECDTEPPVHIDHCPSCRGLFFNPGELEAVIQRQSPEIIVHDPQRLAEIAANFKTDTEVTYRPCPHCRDRMTRVNFGKRSGVIIDRCWQHGVWLDAGELRHLLEWWRAGGKHIHDSPSLEEQTRWQATPMRRNHGDRSAYTGSVFDQPASGSLIDGWFVGELLGGLFSSFID